MAIALATILIFQIHIPSKNRPGIPGRPVWIPAGVHQNSG